MIYLASTYTHPSKDVEASRAACASAVAARLCSLGLHVFSPIAYTETLRMHGPLPGDWAYWAVFDTHMIAVCSTFAVLTIDGWLTSKGLTEEREIARRLGRDEIMVDPYNCEANVPTLQRAEAKWRAL
jgi:hypothetical protein